MKRSSDVRLQNKVFIFIAIFGMIFSIAGLASTWLIRAKLQGFFLNLLDSFDQTLVTTEEGLDFLDDVLTVSTDNLDTIDESMNALGSTIDGLTTSLTTSADLIGDELQFAIIDTQTALSSAATSAVLIDDTLAFIASIPLIGADYQPDVPLHTSLEQAAASLEYIPEAMEDIEHSLNTTAESLGALNEDIESLSESIADLDVTLEHAALIVNEYQDSITAVSETSTRIQRNLGVYLTIGSLIFSGIFFWLGFTQVVILLEILRKGQSEKLVTLTDIHRE